MKLAILSACVVVHLSSCVGGGLMVGKAEEHQGFEVNRTRSKPLRRVTPAAASSNPSKQELGSRWGEPDRRRRDGADEIWIYQSGLAWRGAVPMIGIGIPLVVPVGRNSYDFHFQDGSERAGKLVEKSNAMQGSYYGLGSFVDSKGFGFNRLGED